MFPSLGPSLAALHALLGRELAGALAARPFQLPPSAPVYNWVGPIPSSVLSSSLVSPSLSALIQSVLPLFPLNLESTFSVISLLPQGPHPHDSLASGPSHRHLLESSCAWCGHLPCSPRLLPFLSSRPDSFSLPSFLPESVLQALVLSLVL